MPENIAIFKSGLADAALGGYSELQRQNWAQSKRIKVYESEVQLREFIKSALSDNNFKYKMYFGTIPEILADRIRSYTKPDINVKEYNLTISADEIRKIYKSHGVESEEAARGQRFISEDDFVNIPAIIQNPDKIELAGIYNGKPAIKFTKIINGEIRIVTWISDRSKDLRIQTVYSSKKKSGTLATPMDTKVPILTPEANNGTGSAINNIQKYFQNR